MKAKMVTAAVAGVYGAIVAMIVEYWKTAGASTGSMIAGCLWFAAVCFAVWYLLTISKWN